MPNIGKVVLIVDHTPFVNKFPTSRVDAGVAKTLTTTTAKDDIYAFIFSQKGLMAGLGLQVSKITRINP